MSMELINRITIKKDGVYISTHSSNDDSNYKSVRIESLSKVYVMEGQKGLDREVLRMLYEYAELRGNHKSLDRYRKAMQKADNMYYELLNLEVKTRQEHGFTKPFYEIRVQAREEFYNKVAEFCEEE